MSDLNMIERVFEGSPAIVVILCFGMYMLWTRLEKKDNAIGALQKDMLTTVRDNTEAIRQLIKAIEDKRP